MDGQIANLPADGMPKFLRLCHSPLQADAHIPQRDKAGFRVLEFFPVLRRIPGLQLEHGKAQHIRRPVDLPAFTVNGLYAFIICNQNIDFTPCADPFCAKSFLNAFADNTADGEFLQAQLLKYQINLMVHVNSSSYISR